MHAKMMIGFAVVGMAAGLVFSQGVLVPPGAPGATMKTLTEIDTAITGVSGAVAQLETRIDVATLPGGSTSDYQINGKGSYYLSSDLVVSKERGIFVAGDGITLDLNGFTISKSGTGGIGIYFLNSGSAVVRNGTIRGFERGILCDDGLSLFEDLIFSECTISGLSAGIASRVKACRAVDNTGSGISAGVGSVLEGCVSESNGGSYGISAGQGSSVVNCIARNNAGAGFDVSQGSTLAQCVSAGNSTYGIKAGSDCSLNGCISKNNGSTGFYIASGCSMADCTVTGNGQKGVYSTGDGCVLKRCVVRGNQGDGIFLQNDSLLTDCVANENSGMYGIFANARATMQGCTASYNESGLSASSGIYSGDGSTVRECVAWENRNTYSVANQSQGVGIVVGDESVVTDCSVCQNKGDGIRVGNNCQVVGNQCDYNGLYGATGAGIYVSGRGNRIEENQMTDNDFGMQILVGTNVVSGNCASGNTTDYSLTGTQLQGTAITATGTISTKDAWANFEF